MFQIFYNFDKIIPQYSLYSVSTKTIKDIFVKNLKEHHLIALPTQEEIFSREPVSSERAPIPGGPFRLLIIIHRQCIRRLESILDRDYQPIILICSRVGAIGHRLCRVEISSPFVILYSTNPPLSFSRR